MAPAFPRPPKGTWAFSSTGFLKRSASAAAAAGVSTTTASVKSSPKLDSSFLLWCSSSLMTSGLWFFQRSCSPHIFDGDPSAGAGAIDPGQVNAEVFGEFAGGRRCLDRAFAQLGLRHRHGH